jgi:LysM repeat protein
MRSRLLGALAAPATVALLALGAPAGACAQVPHTVAPGESLYSIAAADGLSVAQLAAANNLSPNSQLLAGSTIVIPPQSYVPGVSAPAAASSAGALDGDGDYDGDTGPSAGTPAATTASSAGALDGDGDYDGDAPASGAAPAASSAGGGTYVVQPGDTLSAIAARAGLTVAQLAAANGLDPSGPLLAGSTITLPGGAPAAASSTPASVGPPYPTPVVLSAGQVGQAAASEGVPGPLADAVGWQESGFNNDLVSPTGAVGVMQIEPSTWSYVQSVLTPGAPLDPYSATDNVRAGSLYLRALMAQTGSESQAIASYYQGPESVQRYGLFPSTQQYVQNILSLEARFGRGG